ncbi:MAG: 50S ribosomal protein L21 [Patescibacteria group bacterium]|jgi:large subunit ribosomal protein L21
MIAVIKTGGKQLVVSPAEVITIEKIPGEVGSTVVFDQVLLVADTDGQNIQIGKPNLTTKVTGTITKQYRAKKIRIVKFKQKVHYRRNQGHRQHQTQVTIGEIK